MNKQTSTDNFEVAPPQPTEHDIRKQAYDLLERSRTYDGTSTGIEQRDADIQQAEDIGWQLYSDDNTQQRDEMNLLLSSVYYERGAYTDAAYYAGKAIENNADHLAAKAFKGKIENAIKDQKPVISTVPTLPDAPLSHSKPDLTHYKGTFNHPLLDITKEEPESCNPYINTPEEDDENGITTFPGDNDRWDDIDDDIEERKRSMQSMNLG